MRSAGVVSVAILLSRLTGLVREIAMARLFGAGIANDAFVIGFRIPNLTRDLFAEGALSSAFVPTFTSYLATKSKEASNRAQSIGADLIGEDAFGASHFFYAASRDVIETIFSFGGLAPVSTGHRKHQGPARAPFT